MRRQTDIVIITGDIATARTAWVPEERLLVISQTLSNSDGRRAVEKAFRRIGEDLAAEFFGTPPG